MTQHGTLALFVCGVGAVSMGCLGPRRSDYQSTQAIRFARGAEQENKLWEVIQQTLRDRRFRLDRVERRTGVITTFPEGSQSFFEFWRHDVDTREDFWEASLNPIRRWVEVFYTDSVDGSDGGLAVKVHKQRLSSPDRQFNSTGAAYQYFGDRLPSTTGLAHVTQTHDRWIDLGRDHAMEQYLLRAILKRAGLDASSAGAGSGSS